MCKRRCVLIITLLLVATAMMPYHALADLLQSTTLTCNDGADLNLALDTTALDALSSAVSAINLYPAGDPALTCALSTPITPTHDSNPTYDYVVGGGRETVIDFPGVCPPFSFSIEAHTPEGKPTLASGHFNRTQSPNTLVTCNFPNTVSQLRVDIDCLMVSGNVANMTGTVREATGFFSTAAGGALVPGSSRVVVAVSDNPDNLNYTSTSAQCGVFAPTTPISSGNITIED